jgi:hypothetical protein
MEQRRSIRRVSTDRMYMRHKCSIHSAFNKYMLITHVYICKYVLHTYICVNICAYLASMKLTTRNTTCSISEAPMIATNDCADTASMSSAEREMVCHTIIACTHTCTGAMKYVLGLRKCKQARPALSNRLQVDRLVTSSA